ncbi:MAG: acetate--CoA ligase family protein [Chloroflexi bacterium]|nr:acetate--CoA ligase family protein [Chloroflexota bacterium]
MRLLEHEAKQLLQAAGVAVPREVVTADPVAAAAFARELGAPVVVKALVPVGGRMKAGGVLFAETSDAAADAARGLIGTTLRGYLVERVSVQEQVAEGGVFYLAATYDPTARRAVLLASNGGGVDIEDSHGMYRQSLDLSQPYPHFRARELASHLVAGREDAPALLGPLTEVVRALVRVFTENDALLVEINPLLIAPSVRCVAADAHIELDDDALFRHRDLAMRFGLAGRGERVRTPLEQRAAEIDGADHRGVAGRVVEFDGDLALLIGGGGASLTTFDAILDAGGKPANYCEIGGNPSVWKIAELTKLLLGKPGVTRRAVIMNVVNNTRADMVARGVIKGVLEYGRDPAQVIAAFRIPGSWEEEGNLILDAYGVKHFGRELSLSDVAERVVRGG